MRKRVGAAAVVSAGISLVGWRANALTGRGAIAATVVGTGVIAGSAWPGAIVLGAFFGSSSALSRLARPSPVTAKGSRRDERQVLANGAVATVGALLGSRIDRQFGLGLAAGALAAATADTWATELGSTARKQPRLLISGGHVGRGTSGAVTLRGSLAAIGGAAGVAAITGTVSALSSNAGGQRWIVAGIAVAGLAGSLVDSAFGELVQERRNCPTCKIASEAHVHHCGTATVRTGGVRGVDNDVVNLVCTAVGSLVALPFVALATGRSDRSL